MSKMIIGFMLLISSHFVFAQDYMYDEYSTATTEGSFPELKKDKSNDQKWSAGIASGVNSPKGEADISADYGILIGTKLNNNVGLGISGNTTRLKVDNDLRQTNVLFRGDYTFGGDVPLIRNTFVGVGAGPVFVAAKTRWAATPLLGFDIPLRKASNKYFSLGLEAKYLFITNTDVPDLFASALAIKYWY